MGSTACTEPQCLYKGALYFFTTQNADDQRAAIYSETEVILEHDDALFHCHISSVVN